MRELARCLTGWDYDWVDGTGLHQLPLRSRPPRRQQQDRLGRQAGRAGDRELQLAGRVPPLRREPEARLASSSTKMWSYFVPTAAAARAPQAALESIYLTGGNYSIRPVLEAILKHPDFYVGAPMVKPPIVYLASLMRASRHLHRRRVSGSGCRATPASGSSTRRTSPAGTTAAGSTRTRCGPAGCWPPSAQDDHHVDVWNDSYDAAEQPEPALDCGARRPGTTRRCAPSTSTRAARLRQQRLGDTPASLAGSRRPYRAARQNALRQLIAVCPDMQLA